ncbi:hypothetical protein GUJ93_ZPchr0006g41157 [Zizania palustris]|uniref:Uncharacterized protein n=1 Tax=Zizania palustris TaxID=103762 RepID=A0A8J5VKI4_ZIZPA|nr:hypothetical protein GUJ93_ZPchr0006g41157 [Zizania palustris]
MSVAAVWKEKVVYAAHGSRRAVRRRGEVAGAGQAEGGSGGGEYGLLDLDVEEEDAAVVADSTAPKKVVAPGPGGTPARPIWQRRVLMGVKCQLPRFSGMILYDERGRPVCSGVRDRSRDQEKHAAAIMVLRDML